MKFHNCVFCNIETNNFAQIVYQDKLTVAFIDPRQFHPEIFPTLNNETVLRK